MQSSHTIGIAHSELMTKITKGLDTAITVNRIKT